MRKLFLIIITVLGLIIPMVLTASVRMDALGSNFSFIIPDTETDIEMFQAHLQEYDKRFVQCTTNAEQIQVKIPAAGYVYCCKPYPDINISILPVLGNCLIN